jgi:hypothetical protein
MTENQNEAYFDIPMLVGKNINQIVEILGSATNEFTPNEQQISMGVNEGDKEYTIDEATLLITYNIYDGIIKEFFIYVSNSDGYTKDKNYLMNLGKLNNSDSKYNIEFVQVTSLRLNPDRDRFTGVVVKPI